MDQIIMNLLLFSELTFSDKEDYVDLSEEEEGEGGGGWKVNKNHYQDSQKIFFQFYFFPFLIIIPDNWI